MKKIIPISIIIILLIAVAYAVMLDLKEAKNINIGEESIVEENNIENNVNDKCVGYISGILEFNSGPIKIPGHIYICAKNLKTEKYYCTFEVIKDYNFSGKDGYQLTVIDDGLYQVAGIFPYSINPGYPLKEFSHSAHCSENICNETPHTFKISCGEHNENIDLNYSHPAFIFKDFDVYSINK